jgi:hypothetical protein
MARKQCARWLRAHAGQPAAGEKFQILDYPFLPGPLVGTENLISTQLLIDTALATGLYACLLLFRNFVLPFVRLY